MCKKIESIGIIGAGTMGVGIAQIAITSSHKVFIFDKNENQTIQALNKIREIFNTLIKKNKISQELADQSINNLVIVKKLEDLSSCDLVIEAVIENLELKQNLIAQLETVLPPTAIIASNTSSLSITAIASKSSNPNRIAGYHFFNPVPLMKVVEVIQGFHTEKWVIEELKQLTIRMGHKPVIAKDTPGFIVNHAGRALGSEAYTILGENVTSFNEIDKILKEGVGFRMGPFELADLTGMDVAHPVSESIFFQYYNEPRYRPSNISRQRLIAGELGKKTGKGFYDYSQNAKKDISKPTDVDIKLNVPTVWLAADFNEDHELLLEYLKLNNIKIDESLIPSEKSLILLSTYGEDATTAARRYKVNPSQVICIDLFYGLNKHRTLMPTLVTDEYYINAAKHIFSLDNQSYSIINESTGFVAQRVLSMVVNLSCDIAQQNIASVEDINNAVKLGLGYPYGSIEWGDILGKDKILLVLQRIHQITLDPRYRPSSWLRRRVELNLPLTFSNL